MMFAGAGIFLAVLLDELRNLVFRSGFFKVHNHYLVAFSRIIRTVSIIVWAKFVSQSGMRFFNHSRLSKLYPNSTFELNELFILSVTA